MNLTFSGAEPEHRERDGRRDRGFSLLEVVIVVVVLGVMAAITTRAVTGAQADAVGWACASERRTLTVATEIYLLQNGAEAIPASHLAPVTDQYEQTLVDSGFLTDASRLYDLGADGSLTAENDSGC